MKTRTIFGWAVVGLVSVVAGLWALGNSEDDELDYDLWLALVEHR